MQIEPAIVSAFSTIARASSGGVLVERLRRRLRVGAARADREQVVLGLDDVAGAGDQQRVLRVRDDQQRLEPAQHAVRAPVLGELDGRAHEVAVLLQLGLEVLEQREGIGRTAGKTREHLALVEAAHLARVALHDLVAERDLAVAAQRHPAVAAHADDRRAVKLSWGRPWRDFKPAARAASPRYSAGRLRARGWA